MEVKVNIVCFSEFTEMNFVDLNLVWYALKVTAC